MCVISGSALENTGVADQHVEVTFSRGNVMTLQRRIGMKFGVVDAMSRGGGAVPNTHSRASAELSLKPP